MHNIANLAFWNAYNELLNAGLKSEARRMKRLHKKNLRIQRDIALINQDIEEYNEGMKEFTADMAVAALRAEMANL